jgi:glycine cleavage system transcriptional repressor
MEHSLPAVAARLGLTTMLRRTTPPPRETDLLPYQIQVVARDNPGIIRDLSEFFGELNIHIVDLYSDTYQAPHTGAPMVVLNTTVNIPSDRPIAEIRDRFGRFCDEHNLDAAMEPVRGHT